MAIDRFQFVHVNDESSLRTRICFGVPQGYVLGPILLLPLGVGVGPFCTTSIARLSVLEEGSLLSCSS